MSYNGAEGQKEAEESPCKLQAEEGVQGFSKCLLWVPAENPAVRELSCLNNNPLQLPALSPYFLEG